jgi:tRNA 5-methylaminomethyl-2-thiouridine biosynthesis bifunctional protein
MQKPFCSPLGVTPLEWTQNQTPIDERFQDKFYSDEDGLGESHYVYLGQNQLPQRFHQAQTFTIAEMGFGTGLNFLATVEAWSRSAHAPNAYLHYISVDRYPLSSFQIFKALSRWPSLSSLTEKLAARIHGWTPGPHRLWFPDEKVILTFLCGDAFDQLHAMPPLHVNAWYLDGFAPAKNPEMWRWEVMEEVARHSCEGATFATFTSTGWVRRNLEAVGFHCEKFNGFLKKREMLRGVFKRSTTSPPQRSTGRMAILGAGLAGHFVDASLQQRGIDCDLFDSTAAFAGSSGHSQLVGMPVVTTNSQAASTFSLAAHFYFWQWLKSFRPPLAQVSGALRLSMNEEEAERFQAGIKNLKVPSEWIQYLDSPLKTSEMAGVPLRHPGLFFRWGSSFSARDLFPHSSVKTLLPNPEVLKDYSHVVFCRGAADLIHMPELSKNLALNRGQLCDINPTTTTQSLRMPVAGKNYITPVNAGTGLQTLGSTYDRKNFDLEIRAEDSNQIARTVSEMFEDGMNASLETSIVSARTGMRVSTSNKLPFVKCLAPKSEHHQGVWMLNGLGSRGLISSGLAAEALVSQMLNEPSPITQMTTDLMEH